MFNDQSILLALGAAVAVVLLAWLVVVPWLKRGPRGELVMGAIWRSLRIYCRLVHRVHFHGLNQFRNQMKSGPLVVVSNHTGAVDPLLLQAGARFHIRWMMASEMMTPSLGWLWKRERIIPVARDGKDSAAAREAIRHVQAGGAIGIFPEGRIVRPPREIRPFPPGVGLIIAKTRAPVLLAWVSGTPDTDVMSKSILTPSHAKVEFIEVIDFKGERDPQCITQHLRTRLAQVSGWPINDQPVPPSEDRE